MENVQLIVKNANIYFPETDRYMLGSLVIRDGKISEIKEGDVQPELLDQAQDVPVSYTHLTLPTILRV